MDNQKVLNQAIILLEELDITNVESVQISNTRYDDGSTSIEVGVSFPATNEITVTTGDNELIASISLSDKDAIVKNGYKVSGYDKD